MRRHGTIASPQGLGICDHVCWGYSDERELRDVAVVFLSEGRRLGQRLLYVADRTDEELVADLAHLEDLDELTRAGELSAIALGATYDASAPLDASRRLAWYAAAVDEAVAAGFTGLRVLADVTPLVRDPVSRAAYARWEYIADRYMGSGNPMSAMCAYDRRVLGGAGLDDVACVHPLVLEHEQAVRFRVFTRGDELVVGGDVDAFSAGTLDRALEYVNATTHSVVDLSEVGFIDHHGLAALSRSAERLAGLGGALTLRGASPTVRRVWELLDLTRMVRWAA